MYKLFNLAYMMGSVYSSYFS